MPPKFKCNIQCILLKKQEKTITQHTFTGLSPSTAPTIPSQLQHIKKGFKNLPLKHHISHISQHGIQFILHRFRSPLLTISQLLSLPPLTKMFQFSGFPILNGSTKKKGQEVPLGNLGIKRSMLLPQAYRSLPRPSQATQAKPSPRQHKQQYFLVKISK